MASYRQRMLAGGLYSGQDPELLADHRRARRLMGRSNASLADEDDLRPGVAVAGEPCRVPRSLPA